jgi:hypothetical protein
VLEDIGFVSFYDCSIGEVMYCICVLGDIEFVSFYDCSIGEVMYCICVLEANTHIQYMTSPIEQS